MNPNPMTATPMGIVDRRRRSLEFLVVVLIPVLALATGTWIWNEDRENAALARLTERLEGQLRLAVFNGTPAARLNGAFSPLFAALSRSGFAESSATAGLPWPDPDLAALVVVFPAKGAPFTGPGRSLPAKFALNRLWGDLRAGRRTSTYMSMYRTFLGRRIRLDAMLAAARGAVPINDSVRPSLLRWQANPDGSGLLVAMPSPPDDQTLITNTLARQVHNQVWATYDPTTGSSTQCTDGRNWGEQLRQRADAGDETVIIHRHLCRTRRHPAGLWLMIGTPVPDRTASPLRRGVTTVTGLALLLIAMAWWFRTNWTPMGDFRLTGRVLTSYLLPVILPLTLILAQGLSALRHREAMLIDDLHHQNVMQLASIDRQFQQWAEGHLDLYRRLRDLPAIRRGDVAQCQALARRLSDHRILAMLKTFRRDGRPILDHDTIGVGPWYELMPAYLLPRYLGVPAKEIKVEVDPIYVDVVKGARGFAPVMDQPDALILQRAGRQIHTLYFDIFAPPGPGAAAIMILLKDLEDDIARFTARRLPPGCASYDTGFRQWATPAPGDPHTVEPLIAAAMVGCEPVFAVDTDGRAPQLWTAYPSRELSGHCFVTSRSLTPVTTALATLRLLLVVLLLITAVSIGIVTQLLSREMLGPIAVITQGLAALERRDLEARLPPLPYEFGHLSTTFNQMMTERQDLDLAREVQLHIMPRVTPQITGYTLTFSCHSLSAVGGDYCDMMRYPDGRWLLLVGDVTGHGMGAAMITTMVKTGALITARRGDDLAVLMARLNKMVFGILRRTANITLAALLLDPHRHQLEWALAGHPSPILRRAAGSTQELVMPGFPLGCVAKRKVQPETLALAVGDTLITYTDGYIESLNAAEEQLGYGRWDAAIVASPTGDARTVHDHLVAVRNRHAGPVPANDDLTLFVLHRDA